MKQKRLLSTLLALCAALACLTLSASVSDNLSWDGGIHTYTIHNAEGWNEFCTLLTMLSFSNITVNLNADITVTTMAGDSEHPFTGTFDGDGKTLTVNYTNNNNDERTAPFRYVRGATIRNLTVNGTISGTAYRAAGIVGETLGETKTTITNCVSSVDVSGGRYTGGISIGGLVDIEGCVFNGKIVGTAMSGGFVGYGEEKTKITDSIFAPRDGSSISGGTFYYIGGSNGKATLTNCRYTRALGTAQGEPLSLDYIDYKNGEAVTKTLNVAASNAAILTGDVTELSGWVVALWNVTNTNRLSVSGEAHLLLCDGATATVPKGVTVAAGSSLTIHAQSDGASKGALVIRSVEDNYAGIGGEKKGAGGSVTINGGSVTATGGRFGAGVGGGDQGAGGTVTINGGSVTANGGWHGAGVGGGRNGVGGTVTINGGTVNATGGYLGAGVGGGHGDGGTVTVNGGTVNATGGEKGAGVGGGNQGAGGSVTLNGGSVTATGGEKGAGVGGGDYGAGGSVTVNGGTVNATGGDYGAGVGGGDYGAGGSVTVNGGTVNATGGKDGAGIGGGSDGDGGTVTLNGGSVTATGGTDAAGIGGSEANNNSGSLTLRFAGSGDSLTASSLGGTVTVDDDRYYADDASGKYYPGELTEAQKTALAGRTLYPAYAVVIAGGIEHGTVTADKSVAIVGDTVTLTVAPDDGYEFDSLSVMNGGTPVAVTDNRFTMPASDVTVSAAFAATAPLFSGKKLLLSGQIGMYFYMVIPEQFVYGSSMTFDVGGETVTVDTAPSLLQADGRYRFLCNLNAVQMADDITATFRYTDGEAEASLTYTTTVEEYLDVLIANEAGRADYAKAAESAKALNDYGYYTQLAVDPSAKHVRMKKAYKGVEDLITTLDGYGVTASLGTGVTSASYSLSLTSETKINLFFVTDGLALTKDNTHVSVNDAATYNWTVERVGERYLVQITGVNAVELGSTFTVTVDGGTTVTASALSYVQQVLTTSQTATDAVKHSAACLYSFFDETVKYVTTN